MISIKEVTNVISKVTRTKSSDFDKLNGENFIEISELMSPVLLKLFKYMFLNSMMHGQRGLLFLFQRKETGDPNNYRGITLTSVFSKIYSTIMKNILQKWTEQYHIWNDYQFGYRPNKSTVDCISILQMLITKTLQSSSKLYCAFIDFQKAFVMKYREGIRF